MRIRLKFRSLENSNRTYAGARDHYLDATKMMQIFEKMHLFRFLHVLKGLSYFEVLLGAFLGHADVPIDLRNFKCFPVWLCWFPP